MSEKSKPKFVVNGKDYPVPTDFTLGELCDAEQYFGVDLNDNRATVRSIAATLFVAIQRVDPTITIEDIRGIPAKQLRDIAAKAGDASPPAQPQSGEKPSESDEGTSEPSEHDGDTPSEPTPEDSGSPGSDDSPSDPPTSAS